VDFVEQFMVVRAIQTNTIITAPCASNARFNVGIIISGVLIRGINLQAEADS
jgi:hypothetical protein